METAACGIPNENGGIILKSCQVSIQKIRTKLYPSKIFKSAKVKERVPVSALTDLVLGLFGEIC